MYRPEKNNVGLCKHCFPMLRYITWSQFKSKQPRQKMCTDALTQCKQILTIKAYATLCKFALPSPSQPAIEYVP